jgi:hypothetical protein
MSRSAICKIDFHNFNALVCWLKANLILLRHRPLSYEQYNASFREVIAVSIAAQSFRPSDRA